MSIKDKLEFCVKHGMTITYIANRMSVEPSTLSKWLHGQKGITHKNENLLEQTLITIVKEMQAALLGEDEYGIVN